MKAQNIYTVPHRRKREGRTNYRKRLKLLQSGKPRLVVRKSLKGMYASLVAFHGNGDRILASSSTQELKKLGWDINGGNLPSAYLVGLLLGTKAKKLRLGEAILDLGLYTPIKKSRLYAALAGAVDAGLQVPHSKDVLPDKDRIEGRHIASYAASAAGAQFSSYSKKHKPDDVVAKFQEMKSKILNA